MLKHLTLIGIGVLLTACSAGGADEPSLAEAYGRQLPIDTNKVTEIWIDLPASVLIKVVAMNDVTVGSFQSGMEYWYASPTSLAEEDELDFGSQSGSYSSTQINEFIGELDPVFEWTQDIGTQGWNQGTYSPVADQARLFRAVDPDDSRYQIGLLIEQDSSDNLRGITWYKQSNTGTIFDTTPGSLTFSLVTDQYNQPSTDPADIDTGTWYYAYSGD